MIAGLSGSLVSHDALERLLARPDVAAGVASQERHAAAALRAWYATTRERLGPASVPRQIYDLAAEPLAYLLGYVPVVLASTPPGLAAVLYTEAAPAAVLIAAPWGEPAGAAWRTAVRHALAQGLRWAMSFNGLVLRVFDAERTYSRRFAEFDLGVAVDDDRTLRSFRWLVGPASLRPGGATPGLERLVALSDRHRTEVGGALRRGVHAAVHHLIGAFRHATRGREEHRLLDESLVVVYRMLFLLFAEARALVPGWHRVFRESYSIEVLQQRAAHARTSAGVWEALQAIARLAHRGCHAASLRVPPFNGPLFSPTDAPLADTLPLDDHAVGQALLALTVRPTPDGAERISYVDLGVEQLGSVYEHLLDFDVDSAPGPARLVATGRRKATGSFYTPRSITEFLVRRTLAPLVADASADAILSLRIVDPAMGSGAFLVAACRYLAAAYEQALIRDGTLAASDIDRDDRAAFRRVVAQRCLFGVDANPMAVQLGRLSLWLATLAADKPLSFLDHRLRSGNSLVGAGIEEVLRPAGGRRRTTRSELPLFDAEGLHASLQMVVGGRLQITDTPDDTLQQVRSKSRLLTALSAEKGPLGRWARAADLWCAAWYGSNAQLQGPALRALLDHVLGGRGTLPSGVAEPMLARAADTARSAGFFHWPFEFPEIFHDDGGAPRQAPGFDAVIGNPPWDMLREQGASRPRQLARFVRDSGVYTLQRRGSAHLNLYQLFVERALRLVKPGGRLGFVLPSGFANDHAAAALRTHVFGRTEVDTFTTLENKEGLFPVHRDLKFLLLTLTTGGTTGTLPVVTGVRSAAALERIPDAGADTAAVPVPRALLERVSGDTLAVPAIRSIRDLEILGRIVQRTPSCGEPDGWHIRFGRELNVTDDRRHFSADPRALPVLEGKQIHPFRVETAACRFRIAAPAAARLLDAGGTFARPRLAYREVASATNRLTLIAAIVPARVVTSHTVFCLKTPLDEEAQQFLCGVFNSFVANYLVRLRVGTHVTAAIISGLRVPRPGRGDPRYTRVAALSRSLSRGEHGARLAELNATVAALYGMTAREFAHILETFPLVSEADRSAALERFEKAPGWMA